ncbi:MAG: hypothetical protein EU544_04320 [Promethearchaeota archaeon]|nr:MAG: hypothetical protein EU544_04320 [Candidatus Lokiarchaeota archaeon]
MYILRRISEKDAQIRFKTGNKAFDEINPDGTLKNYLDQDNLHGGNYLTFLLLENEEERGNSELLAVLRFKYPSIEEYLKELTLCSVSEKNLNTIREKIEVSNLKLVYLSRIGVIEKFQEMNISQIMINFFEFLIAKNRVNVLIYIKALKGIKRVIGPSYRLIGKNQDEKWGDYFLASRIIKFEPK